MRIIDKNVLLVFGKFVLNVSTIFEFWPKQLSALVEMLAMVCISIARPSRKNFKSFYLRVMSHTGSI